MKCPFCGGEMQAGTISFDGRTKLFWLPDGENKSSVQRFLDAIGGIGSLTAGETDFWSRGRLKSDYCPDCRKMIFDTDIEQ